jgi:hypothetical protein
MKKIKLLTFLITLFILNSCNNDENEQIDANGIMGSYRITSYTYKGNYLVTKPGIDPRTENFSGFGKNFNYQSEIRERPNTWSFVGTVDWEVTDLNTGTTSTIPQVISQNSTWTKIGDNIIITFDNGKVANCIVTEGNNKYMVIKYSLPISYDDEQGFHNEGSYTEIIMRLDRNQ